MSIEGVPNVATEGLRSEASLDSADTALVRFLGTAESEAMPVLSDLLKKLHAGLLSSKVREVTVDLRDLEFMNSSCFKAFVTWVGFVEEVPAEQQYTIRFLSDPKKHWQERSLGALTCFATHLIRVEN